MNKEKLFVYSIIIVNFILTIILFLNLSNSLQRTVIAIETYRGQELKLIKETQEDIIFINNVIIEILKRR